MLFELSDSVYIYPDFLTNHAKLLFITNHANKLF